MAELDFAAWTEAFSTGPGGTQTIVQASATVMTWAVEQVRDRTYTLVASDTAAQVEDAGRYLARYDFGVRSNPNAAGTRTRALIRSLLQVNGTDQVHARAAGYWRNAQASTLGHCTAAAVLELAASDQVSVTAQRIDTETASRGTSVRDASFEGQLALWRLRDSWRVLRVRLDSDASASTTGTQVLDFDVTELADAGWTDAGSGQYSFDPDAAGTDYSGAFSYVFLVAFTIEAEITSGTAEGEFGCTLQFSDGSSLLPSFKDQYFTTCYAEGAGGCTVATCGFLGLVDGANGEPGVSLERLRLRYTHRNTNATTFTPKGGRCSLQIVAIPRAHLQYAQAREQTGGQAIDVDGAITFDTTAREDAPLDHGASSSSEVRVGYPGAYVLAMASLWSGPNGAARNTNRLVPRVKLEVEATAAPRCGAAAHNRGTNGCEHAGISAHGVLLLATDEDLRAYHDNLNAQTDTAVDVLPPGTGLPGPTRLSVLVLRRLGQFPDPVEVPLEAPAVARVQLIEPTPVLVPVTPPAVARLVTLLPSPVLVPLEAPAVARLVTLLPAPVEVPLEAPAVALLSAQAPAPVEVPLEVPAVARLVTLLPSPVLVPVVAAAVARQGAVLPAPVLVPIELPAVARTLQLVPAPVSVPVTPPAVARLVVLLPSPVLVPLEVPAVALLSAQAPAPVEVPLEVPAVARLVVLLPDPVQVPLEAPAVARTLQLGPAPVLVPLALPAVAVLQRQNPDPVQVPLEAPAVARLVTLLPSPVQVPLEVPAVARTLQLEPSPVLVPLEVPAVTRTLQLVPGPVLVPVVMPEPLLGIIAMVVLRLELARRADLEVAAGGPELAAALSRALEAQARLEAAPVMAAGLALAPELAAALEAQAELWAGAAQGAELSLEAPTAGELAAALDVAALARAMLAGGAAVPAELARGLEALGEGP